MLNVRIGQRQLQNTQFLKRILKYATVLAAVVTAVSIILLNSSYSLNAHSLSSPGHGFGSAVDTQVPPKKKEPTVGPCGTLKTCPKGHFSFYIMSGAANVLPPKICWGSKLLVGSLTETAGEGINIAVVNGKTGELNTTGHFNMYDGEIEPLIKFLQSIQQGSVVLMASYDDPATKLSGDARKLIGELGSSAIQSVGFRDNWVFVGGKGSEARSPFEKHIKNNKEKNKYDDWPEIIDLEGCIPPYLE